MIPKNTHDAIYNQERRNIPLEFLKALSQQESNLDPKAISPGGGYVGLFQIGKEALRDYALITNQTLSLEQRNDPRLNTQVAVWKINQIIDGYVSKHPKSVKADWKNEAFIGLVTQGFNAGYSDTGGVGEIIGKMEAQGIAGDRIDYKTVAEANKAMKINKFLSEPERMAYVGRVVRDYRDQGGFKQSEPEKLVSSMGLSSKGIWIVATLGLAALAYNFFKK